MFGFILSLQFIFQIQFIFMRIFLLPFVLFTQVLLVFGQTTNDQKYKIHIRKALNNIKLDGILDKEEWSNSDIAKDFICAQPTDGNLATDQTEVYILFDEKNIYVGAKCWQKRDKYVVQSLRRDYAGGTTDIFGVNFDTFKDKQNAFNFTVSPYNIQREGLIANGTELNTDWDNRWFSEVKNYDDFWTVEMAIPFKTLRYKQVEGQAEWLVNFTRYDQGLAATERSSWSPIPRQFSGNTINFSGLMIWDAPPPSSGKNIALIPYLLTGVERDILGKKKAKRQFNIGGDAKIAVTSSLNLDLTFNPDFAQVEVDKQQTNLSRFELLFPERRQFFIENSDLFGTFGFESINPLFSRRIGLSKDAKGNNVQVPILAGARLTGRLNKRWRIGLLDVQTDNRSDLKLAGNNFLATAIQRKVLKRSNLAFIFANKQNFTLDTLRPTHLEINTQNFNRVAGVDFNFFSGDNRWQAKTFLHRSFDAQKAKNPFSGAFRSIYKTKNISFTQSTSVIGEGYNAEMGYVPRKNLFRIKPEGHYTKWVEGEKIQSFLIGPDGDLFWRFSDGKFTDYDFSPVVFGLNFQNGTRITLTPLRYDYTYLINDFDPTNTNGKKLLAGTDYTYKSMRFSYTSDLRRHFSYALTGRLGEYFNGNIQNLVATASYRYQPYGIFSLDVNYNKINLPEGYNDRELWLIGPRFDLSFPRNIYFTTFIQYNNQINNLNLNARLQWRFAPVSDLFLVYTDNYFAENDALNGYQAFQTKNRAFLLKCTYWLNL